MVTHRINYWCSKGCHILEKSWIFLLSWKVLENIWEVFRASPGQNSEATYMVSHKKRLEGTWASAAEGRGDRDTPWIFILDTD